MGKLRIISAKIPEEVYKELVLRVPEGERSEFLREAILEKLQRVPRPDRILELQRKVDMLEAEIFRIKKHLAELEVLTYEENKVNPHTFCIDEMDHKIIDYLLDHEGATTPELADLLKTNRWHVLNRLRKIQKRSKKQLGKPIVEYYAGKRMGKRKAWWIREELIQL
jgi:Arc/MetJ-type ribon-helix-helix transcriptional regulator